MKNIRFSAMKNEDEKMEIEINDDTQKVKKKITVSKCFQDVMVNVKQLKITI